MVKLGDLRRASAEELKKLNNESPRADVDFILSALLGFSKTEILIGDRLLTDEETFIFNNAFTRLKSGEPVQYIAGRCEFMSLDFTVNSNVLIPRSDTEILTEAVINLADKIPDPHILEIGCGSGCISVSIAHYAKNAQITALDISEGALMAANQNAVTHRVSDRITFLHHDILSGFPKLHKPVDIIVSNPPYIPRADIDALDKKVREFEPWSALDGGTDGLIFYRHIAECAERNRGGYLAFEVGINQAEAVGSIMEKRFTDITFIKDINKIDRTVLGRFKG